MKNRVVVTERHTETQTVFHFASDGGLTKFETRPWGGGRAGVGEAILINNIKDGRIQVKHYTRRECQVLGF